MPGMSSKEKIQNGGLMVIYHGTKKKQDLQKTKVKGYESSLSPP